MDRARGLLRQVIGDYMDYGCITGIVKYFNKKTLKCDVLLDIMISDIQPLLREVPTLSIGSHKNKIFSIYRNDDLVLVLFSKACRREESFRDDGQIGFHNPFIVGSLNRELNMNVFLKIYKNIIDALDFQNQIINKISELTIVGSANWGPPAGPPATALASIKLEINKKKKELESERKDIYGI